METKKTGALGLDEGGVRIDPEALAKIDAELASQIGLAGMSDPNYSPREAGKRLAKAGILEKARKGERASEADALALRALAAEGDLSWAEGLGAWASRNDEAILAAKASAEELCELEKAFPGFLRNFSDERAASRPEAAEALFRNGLLSQTRIEGILRSPFGKEFGEEASAAGVCAERDPEATAKAWGEALTRPGDDKITPNELAAAWAGMGAKEAAVAARGIAEAMAGKKRVNSLRLVAEAIVEMSDLRIPLRETRAVQESAEEGAARFVRELARSLAAKPVGAKALPWKGETGKAFQRWDNGRVRWISLRASQAADLPLEWALKEGAWRRTRSERLALEWWKGWKEGGGPAPGILALTMRGEPLGASADGREGAETLAIAASEALGLSAAAWLLRESGWASLEGIESAKGIARRIPEETGVSLGAEETALLEAAEMGLVAKESRGKEKKPRGPKAGL